MSEATSVHVTSEELRQLLEHRLPPNRIAAAARHLGQCAGCAAAARDRYDVAAAAEAIGKSVLVEGPSFRRGPLLRTLTVAAALAIGAIGLALRLARPTEAPVRVVHRDRWSRMAEATLLRGRLTMPAVLRGLRPPAGSLRGATSGTLHVRLWPAGLVVEDDRPELRWEPVPRATSYRVLLFRDAVQVAAGSWLTLRSWRPEQPLDRGATYDWQVIARVPGGELAIPAPPSPPALFQVLSRPEREELEAARRAHPGDRLLLGVLYARAGMADRAAAEVRAYATAHPGDGRAQALWHSVEDWPTSD